MDRLSCSIVICSLGLLAGLFQTGLAQRVITINGGWSPWSTVATPCLRQNLEGAHVPVTCGGGNMTRKRSCTNPVPQGVRPKYCEGEPQKQEECNTNPCDMQWSTWSNCSATCGRGSRLRITMCALSTGGDLKSCASIGLTEQAFEHSEDCNTWDLENCPSPCLGYNCMAFGLCVDKSDQTDPKVECQCQMNRVMNEDESECVMAPPPAITKRPDPTLPPHVKTATSIVTKSASSVLIIFVGITMFLFASLRIYNHARVIQLNMEIALVCAHICLLLPDLSKVDKDLCRIVSILIHFFFTATFMFMFLESLHTYSIVAYVVKKNGMLTRLQNVLVGWGFPLAIVLCMAGMQYENYGGGYHCWLQVDTNLMFGQMIPIVVVVILTFTLIEAAGAADYRRLPGLDQQQLVSAKIMQRTNLIIMPMVFISFIIGVMSEYNQDVALYGTFTVLNGFLGAAIFFFHSTGNEQVRDKLGALWSIVSKK